MQDFRKLEVWQLAHAFRLAVYPVVGRFPRIEQYGLAAQLRGAATSIASNIAEGCGRGTDADFKRFLHNAMGSADEALDQLILAHDLRYVTAVQFEELENMLGPVRRKLARLIDRLRGREE